MYFARSQAPAWECSLGSSSFPTREARASLTGFPSRSLGTSVNILKNPCKSVLSVSSVFYCI
ncbi:MAG: hypothetical protein EPN17_10470 [Methylobacter sp.]|nr:MAG: hypothetical protein EPN17_10470 [Methylobacter sp.]